MIYDVAVIGGGIVGMAAAKALLEQQPERKLILFEKEPRLAKHQSGRNSGVVHSGIYYRKDSLKARLCVQGVQLMESFCEAQRIPYKRCGKVIVATREEELPRLEALYQQGNANGIPGLRCVDADELRSIEPHINGIAALHLPNVAVVDFAEVVEKLAECIKNGGAEVKSGCKVTRLRYAKNRWNIETDSGHFEARAIVNCAGLYACKVGRMAADSPKVHNFPIRGEYYRLPPARAGLVNGLVYPVPDPALPFLGVHITKTIHGNVLLGPNAVLAFKREGYKRTDFSVRDTLEMAVSPGFWKMAGRYWKVGLSEGWRSLSRRAFLKTAQSLMPELQPDDLQPSPAGVRAQAVDASGTLVHDFVLHRTENALHVYNAPSPAATASLAIGKAIAGRF